MKTLFHLLFASFATLFASQAMAEETTSSMGAEPQVANGGNVAIVRQTGGANVISIQQSGENNQAITNQNGENNDVNVVQTGKKNDLQVSQTGDHNTLERKQTGKSRTVINQNGEITTIYEDSNQ